MDRNELTAVVLMDVENQRHDSAEPELEGSLSINDWIERIKNATVNARACARAGSHVQEYSVFVEIAAIAVGRAEQIREVTLKANGESFS